MRTTISLLFSLVTLMLVLPSCKQRSFSVGDVPSGASITKKYSIKQSFCNINNQSPAHILFTQGAQTKVEAYGDEKIIAHLSVLVEDSTLFIRMNQKQFKQNAKARITIAITSPHLRNISQRGVGNLTLKDSVQSEHLSIQSEGVGNLSAEALFTRQLDIYQKGVGSIHLEGQAETARFEQNGVGSLNAKDLVVAHLTVEQNGVGSVSCYASHSISIYTKGIGSVDYYGNPQTTDLRKKGIGSVTHKQ